jgi:TPR repeat protein
MVLAAVAGSTPAADFDSGLGALRSRDYARALEQWSLCAEKGDAACQFGLGVLHDDGLGVPREVSRALSWYERAAAQDYPDALMQLGFLYAVGRQGVEQDPVRAWAWFARAAAVGVEQAPAHRDRVGELLTPDELAAAQKMADELSIRYHLQK